jgi:hypothetical protein
MSNRGGGHSRGLDGVADANSQVQVKELILTELVKRCPQKVNTGEISEADGQFVQDKATQQWVWDNGNDPEKPNMEKGFTANFRPPPPEMKAQLDESKSAAGVRRFLLRQGYRPPAFLSDNR